MNRTLGPRPRLDLIESESAYELFAAVPGDESRLVGVDFKAGILSVDVQLGADSVTPNRLAPEPTAKRWKLCVGFGDLVSGDEIRAVHAQGVLHIHLPKAEKSDPGQTPSPRLESSSTSAPEAPASGAPKQPAPGKPSRPHAPEARFNRRPRH